MVYHELFCWDKTPVKRTSRFGMGLFRQESIRDKKCVSKLVTSESIKYHIKDYCRSTSVHGLKYLVQEHRPLSEKLCWLTMFLICIVVNAYLVHQVWRKWNDSPVIVAFAETATPVWNVPFPAVSICSEVKSRATEFNISSYIEMSQLDEEIEKKLGDVSLVCDDHVMRNGSDYADDSTIEFLLEVAPPFLDTVFICRWKDKVSQNCTGQFTRIFTDEGVCYTFNMLDREDLFREAVISNFETDYHRAEGWTLDGGYPREASLETYPYRALNSGHYGGLFVVLKAKRDDADFYCKGPIQGFKILIHNPAEFPMVGERYLKIPLSQELLVVVQPTIMTTSEGLRSYSPQIRHCYFQSERYLAYFKVYTQRNCEMECITNYTRRECGCVAQHMPRRGDTKICGPGKKKCMIEAAHRLRLSQVVSSFKSETMGSCDCLPSCTSIGYNAESSQADFNFIEVIAAYGENVTEYEPYDASRVSIFFKEWQFTTSRRNELYGIVDFLASCGGLLGLCCGISVLSIFEILYYVTLRLWGNLKVIKKAKKNKEEA